MRSEVTGPATCLTPLQAYGDIPCCRAGHMHAIPCLAAISALLWMSVVHGEKCIAAPLLLQATEEISAFICPALVDDHGHAVLRLSMGRLLDTLLANMDAARHQEGTTTAEGPSSSSGSSSPCQQQRRMMLYSGHDSTIMPLLTGELETSQINL